MSKKYASLTLSFCANKISVVTCPPLVDPENGKVLNNSSLPRPYQMVSKISCNEGYRLEGSDSRTCLSNGTWSGAETYCVCEYMHFSVYNINIFYSYSFHMSTCICIVTKHLINYRRNDPSKTSFV